MVRDQKKKTSKRRWKAVKAVDVMRPLMDRAIRSKGFVQTEVVTRWRDIVGHELSMVTLPVSLRFARGTRTDGTLEVRCESAFAPLLQHRHGHVIDLVNQYFGYGAVSKLRVVQGPLPHQRRAQAHAQRPVTDEDRRQLNELLSAGHDGDLKSALMKLGEQVYTRKKE